MVEFLLEKGRKDPHDYVVKIKTEEYEILTFRDILFLLSHIFSAEDYNYPISQGFQGKAMLLKAIIDVYSGIPLDVVLKHYRVNGKQPLKKAF